VRPWFQGYNSDTKTVAVKLTWSDSTIFPNALGSDVSNYIDPQTYLGFSSSNPTVISIDALGEATLLQNYHNYVDITTVGLTPN